MKLWRELLLITIAAGPAAAGAFLSATVTSSVREAGSGKPLDGAFVVVREFADVGQLHGSKTYCVRAGVAAAEGGSARLELPGAGSDSFRSSRAFEGFAYRPGYCMARIGDAVAASRNKRVSVGMAPPPVLDPSQEARFEMRPSTQSPEERLLYLERLTAGLACHEARWGSGSPAAMGKLADAILAEANEIAKTRYEKALASHLASRLAEARRLGPVALPDIGLAQVGPTQGFPRDFMIAPADTRVMWSKENPAVVGITSQAAVARAASPPAGSIPGHAGANLLKIAKPEPQQLAIHCRHGAPTACDLDEKNAQGETALWYYVYAGKVDEVRVMLAAGADPNIGKRPGGRTPIEMALGQMLLNYDNASKASEIVDLLAADPRTTLFAPLKEDLAAEPSTWQVHSPQARERLLQRRERLTKLPARQPAKPACEPPGFDWVSEEPPPRLRYGTGARN